VTVSSSGIQLLNNEALVYYFAPSTGYATSNSLFAVIDYRNTSWSAADMILIAQRELATIRDTSAGSGA
jgi:hypothetical protein